MVSFEAVFCGPNFPLFSPGGKFREEMEGESLLSESAEGALEKKKVGPSNQ